MSFEVDSIPNFEREAKRLKKKYISLKEELASLITDLEVNPIQGTPLKNDFYKIRLSIKSKGKGKRGGARVITLVKIVAQKVYLVSIYDKSEQSNIDGAELDRIILELP